MRCNISSKTRSFSFSQTNNCSFHNISCSPLVSPWAVFYPFSLAQTELWWLINLILITSHSPVSSHSPGSLTLRWSHSSLPTLSSPQLTSCWGRSNRASASGSRSGDLGNVARTRGQTLPSQSTLNRPKNTMEISLYWPCLMLGDTGGHHCDENIHESSGSEQSGPRVIVKYFNTTLGTKTFLPKKVNKHKSFSVLWGKETKYTIYNGVFEIWHDKRM